jgi:hypothetical protein
MHELWRALIARLVYWLTPKPPAPPAPVVVKALDPPLRNGTCVCTHGRNCHRDGKGSCSVAMHGPDDKHDGWWGVCACQVFILDDDDDEDEPEAPTPSELERLYQK